jgi:hypothetical protein
LTTAPKTEKTFKNKRRKQMKKIAIMAALAVAATTTFGAISINWDAYGFLSGADSSKYASQDGVKLVWDLVYTTASSITAPTYDEGTSSIKYASTDTVLSRRTWEEGSTEMKVDDLVTSATASSSPLVWDVDGGCIDTGSKTYKNYDDTRDAGGIYAAVFQYMSDGTIYTAMTELNSNINWAATPTGGSDKVSFNSKADTQISTLLYKPTVVPEPATMSLLGLGALAMVIRRKLRK